jgi:hypothetical protein
VEPISPGNLQESGGGEEGMPGYSLSHLVVYRYKWVVGRERLRGAYLTW